MQQAISSGESGGRPGTKVQECPEAFTSVEVGVGMSVWTSRLENVGRPSSSRTDSCRHRIERAPLMATPEFLNPTETFVQRHLGPTEADVKEMLALLGMKSLQALTDTAVPRDIQ